MLREAMRIADRLNEAFDAAQPWLLAKNPEKRDALQTIASQSLQGFQQLTVMLAPVLPGVARRVARELFGLDRDFVWNDAAEPSIVRPFKHLMTRIAEKQIDALLAGPEFLTPGPSPAAAGERRDEGTTDAPTISIADFAKVDLRVARIVNAEAVDGAEARQADARHRRGASSDRVRRHQGRVPARGPSSGA